MGAALELITGLATAPGAAGANLVALTENSFTLRDSPKPIWLGPVWLSKQVAGDVRITSPLLHDATVGMHINAPTGQSVVLWTPLQRLYSQDTLSLNVVGSGTAGDIEHGAFLVFYEDLPGVAARLIDRAELHRRGEHIYAFTNTIATGLTGQYTGSEAVSAEEDQLKANRDYAILGYNLRSGPCAALRYVSSQWGNLGIGGPGIIGGPDGWLTRDWFVRLSDLMGMPAIPVFNSANKAQTLISAAQDENGADPIVSTICCLLSPGKR